MSALSTFFYEQAQKALNTVDPIPPASPYLRDWSMDATQSCRLTDAELVDKMRWELEALKKRERLQQMRRVLDVPTVYPEAQ